MSQRKLARRAGAILCGLALTVSLAVSSAQADDLSDRQSRANAAVQQAQAQVNGSTAALSEANARVATAEQNLAAAQDALTQAQAVSTQAAADLAAAEAINQQRAEDLAAANRQLAEAKAAEAAGQAALDAQADNVGTYARSIFQDSLPLVSLAALFNADSTASLSDRIQWTSMVLDTNQAILDDLKQAQARLAAARASRQAAQVVADQAKQAAQEQADQAAQAKRVADDATAAATAAEQAVQAALDQETAAKQAAAAQLAADQAMLASAQADLDAVNAQVAEMARQAAAAAAAGTTVPGGYSGVSSHGLVRPVPGPVTSGYGWRVHPITHKWTFHDGVDYGSPCGTPILAAAAGRVTAEGWNGGYGQRIVLDNGWISGHYIVTSYNHMSRYAVGYGATVAQGQVIGYVGTTGLSTGCHLHLSLWVDGKSTDVRTWL